jgi:hypothetical protein
MDELPAIEEAPPRAVEFAPRAIRPPGRRGPTAAGVWALALAGIVAVGMLAGEPPAAPAPAVADSVREDSAAELPARPAPSLPSTRMGALLLRDVVELRSPAPARVEITTPSVAVEGVVLVRAARVLVFLEARANRVLDRVTVDVSDRDGGVRPERAPTFEASFELPFPRPNGTMWVVVTAYDERGMPLGGTRRPFAVGPLVQPSPEGTEVSHDQG